MLSQVRSSCKSASRQKMLEAQTGGQIEREERAEKADRERRVGIGQGQKKGKDRLKLNQNNSR